MSLELKTNTAVRIPVGPLVDPTDGKTAETALTVTDLSVQIYQVKTDGTAVVRTQFTPTASGGSNDMALVTSSTDGMYDLELTATQLNWLGVGKISFYDVDGFLVSWIDIHIVSANYFDNKYGSTIESVNTTQLSGTTQTANDIGADIDAILVDTSEIGVAGAGLTNIDLPDQTMNITGNLSGSVGSVTAQVSANVTALSGDSTAADNIELQYDGVNGLDGEFFPASQGQVDGLGAASGAAFSFPASEDNTGGAIIDGVTFVGAVQDSTTYANTENEDGSIHDIDDVANDIDIVYGFDVGGNRTATQVSFLGNVNGNLDEMSMKVYDHVGATWDKIATVDGSGGSTYLSLSPELSIKHTGTGSELGKVYIRFDTDNTTPSNLSIDKLRVAAVNIGVSVGYALGRIWLDTINGTAGTEAYVNGVADNPVDNLADALTLSAAVGLKAFHMAAGSSITLTSDAEYFNALTYGGSYDLAGYSIANSVFEGGNVTGTGTSTNGNGYDIKNAHFENITLTAEGVLENIGFKDFTATSSAGVTADEIIIRNGYSEVAGAGSPAISFAGVTKDSSINVRGWHGGGIWTFNAYCTASIEVYDGGGHTITTGGGDIEFRGKPRSLSITSSGTGTTQILAQAGDITIAGTGGTVNIYGSNSGVTDNSGGSVTINKYSENTGDTADILEDTGTTIPAQITALNDLSAAEVNTEVNNALNTAIPASPTADSINDYIARMKKVMVNKMTITEANGNTIIYEDNDTTEYANVLAAYASDSTTTTRKRLE